MSKHTTRLSASGAAERLGVTTKALRLYERHGLVTPGRTAAGYRVYGSDEMRRASEVATLRALGLSLAQVARVLKEGDAQSLDSALGAHAANLERKIHQLVDSIDTIREIRTGLARGQLPAKRDLAGLPNTPSEFTTAFDLPWPWGGERFELREVRPLNYIIGPLESGKTRLAVRLSEELPNAVFLGLDRLEDGPAITVRLVADANLKTRIDQALMWINDEGGTESKALTALLVGLETDGSAAVVVDMVEQGLDQATQKALIRHLRRRAQASARPLFLMTRSSAILDLSVVGPDETIILCPANHSPPTRVAPSGNSGIRGGRDVSRLARDTSANRLLS